MGATDSENVGVAASGAALGAAARVQIAVPTMHQARSQKPGVRRGVMSRVSCGYARYDVLSIVEVCLSTHAETRGFAARHARPLDPEDARARAVARVGDLQTNSATVR